MASGHVNRTQRPNTWLHRPSLRREDSPCQLGAVHTWPRLCEKSHGCYDSFFESAGGSDGCQALWKGLTEANAHFSLPCLTTTWPRTIRFVRLTRSLKVLILISLALVGLSRWKRAAQLPCGDTAQDIYLWLSQSRSV